MPSKLTIGPLFYYWTPAQKRDFYFRIADEAPIDTVYLGEVVCSKRTPFFEKHYKDVARRLEAAGKTAVFSTLSEVMSPHDCKSVEKICGERGIEIEANDASALWHLDNRRFRIGQLFNCYNGETLSFLAGKGAYHACLPAEMPAESIEALSETAKALDVAMEVQVFGRMSLALSARCYHARAHGRIRDNCRFVCERDRDGMVLRTIDNVPFLAVNGVQTLSYSVVTLAREIDRLEDIGISHFRLSPHSNDMVEVASIFDRLLRKRITADEADRLLEETGIGAPFSNGFFHKRPGHQRVLEKV